MKYSPDSGIYSANLVPSSNFENRVEEIWKHEKGQVVFAVKTHNSSLLDMQSDGKNSDLHAWKNLQKW
jgi:hypothetical protein